MVRFELFYSRAFSGAKHLTLILCFALSRSHVLPADDAGFGWGQPEWQASLTLLPLSSAIAASPAWPAGWADRVGPRLPLTLGAR